MWKQYRFEISEHGHIGEARRLALTAAEALDFDEILKGRVGIVVTELATNIVKHTPGGEILIIESNRGLHVLALDKGKGMADIAHSMRDGVSTGGTAGNGLGAIKRNATTYDLFTATGKGTVFYVSFCKGTVEGFPMGVICRPYPGEEIAGDTWALREDKKKLELILSDGLGHGLMASEASKLSCEIFQEETKSQTDLMDILHRALRPTRGAAVSLATIDLEKRTLSFCGVGNVSGEITGVGVSGKKCISYNGTVGVQIRKVQSLTYPFDEGDIFVLASDGISTQWDLKDYPGAMNRHPFVIAGLIYRDFAKNTDDATVIVVKEAE